MIVVPSMYSAILRRNVTRGRTRVWESAPDQVEKSVYCIIQHKREFSKTHRANAKIVGLVKGASQGKAGDPRVYEEIKVGKFTKYKIETFPLNAENISDKGRINAIFGLQNELSELIGKIKVPKDLSDGVSCSIAYAFFSLSAIRE